MPTSEGDIIIYKDEDKLVDVNVDKSNLLDIFNLKDKFKFYLSGDDKEVLAFSENISFSEENKDKKWFVVFSQSQLYSL